MHIIRQIFAYMVNSAYICSVNFKHMKPYITPQKGDDRKRGRKPKYQTAARKAVLRAVKKAMRRELNKTED